MRVNVFVCATCVRGQRDAQSSSFLVACTLSASAPLLMSELDAMKQPSWACAKVACLHTHMQTHTRNAARVLGLGSQRVTLGVRVRVNRPGSCAHLPRASAPGCRATRRKNGGSMCAPHREHTSKRREALPALLQRMRSHLQAKRIGHTHSRSVGLGAMARAGSGSGSRV